MSLSIRRARADDREPIAAFTVDTFSWGDYVADVFTTWLDEPDTAVYVATDDRDVPVALGRARMLAPTEAWFHAARVRPDHRGRGIAGELAGALMDWASDQGALVGRLLIEDWNEASSRHVAKIGFRPVAGFTLGVRAVGDASPFPAGNGGKRGPARLRARPAGSAEAEPAYSSWAVGPLGRAARGLFGVQWAFRRLTASDLGEAATNDALWEIGAGWAMASRGESGVEVAWLETRPEDAGDLIRALVDLATSTGVESLRVWLPTTDWLVREARRERFEIHPMAVHAREL
jgi:GNAT superfamily N-acetyltransferase